VYHDFTYAAVLASSLRAQWELDDVLRADEELDFSRNFLPEPLARTAAIESLDANQQRMLNHISAHQYLHLFAAVEEFILPFVMDHARPLLNEDDYRVRALLNFACEEAKHIHLFKRFEAAFDRGFPVKCRLIGPPDRLAREVMTRDPLAIGLIVLMIEWMTQDHYLGSIRDDGEIDPLFRKLLKFHWIEEAQHAKLDTLIVDAIAETCSEADIQRAVSQLFELTRFLDDGLRVQAWFNVDSLERLIGRRLADRRAIAHQQHLAARWMYVRSGLAHARFAATLEAMSPLAAARVAEAVRKIEPPQPIVTAPVREIALTN